MQIVFLTMDEVPPLSAEPGHSSASILGMSLISIFESAKSGTVSFLEKNNFLEIENYQYWKFLFPNILP